MKERDEQSLTLEAFERQKPSVKFGKMMKKGEYLL
jgi:hypothetical protein